MSARRPAATIGLRPPAPARFATRCCWPPRTVRPGVVACPKAPKPYLSSARIAALRPSKTFFSPGRAAAVDIFERRGARAAALKCPETRSRGSGAQQAALIAIKAFCTLDPTKPETRPRRTQGTENIHRVDLPEARRGRMIAKLASVDAEVESPSGPETPPAACRKSLGDPFHWMERQLQSRAKRP